MQNIFRLLAVNFLGQSPTWYKITILSFLVLNPLLFFCLPNQVEGFEYIEHFGHFVAGWAVLIQFIFALACALKCYPLQPGGLLAIEALFIGLTDPKTIYHEVLGNAPTLLLLIFMVSAIYFIKDVLFIGMTKLFLAFRKKYVLALVFCVLCASLSAFLDALTLVAIAIAVCFNFYAIYHRVESDSGNDEEMEEFRGFLRDLIIHGAVGTIIGGAMTEVGEPQNIMIGHKMDWSFLEFIIHCGPVSFPAAFAGFFVCFALEFFRCPGFQYQMPDRARELIQKDYAKKMNEMTGQNFYVYAVQIIAFVMLVFALAFHIAEVGLIGIGLIVFVTAFTGLTKEHDIGGAFVNAMPFAVLIVVFFAILGVVHSQHLVTPLAEWVFKFEDPTSKLLALFFTNGTLSFISDNVFVATVFITEVESAYVNGVIAQMIPEIQANYDHGTMGPFVEALRGAVTAVADKTEWTDEMRQYIGIFEGTIHKTAWSNETVVQFISKLESANMKGTVDEFIIATKDVYANKTIITSREFERLAVVVNMGTNIPAMATPNGHAALLFLLTSSLAPLLKLSYLKMIELTLPYTIVMTTTGALAIYFFV